MQYLNYNKYFQTAYLEENYTVKKRTRNMGILLMVPGVETV